MKAPKFSNRTDWTTSTNKITQVLTDLKGKQAPVIDLTISNPTECGFAYPVEILQSLNDPKNFIYEPHSAGMLEARLAVSEYYRRRGFEVSPERILLTASTSEAYNYLF